MKHLLLTFSLALAFLLPQAQTQEPESLGLPGDNLNLYAVLKIFQESPTLEEFEKKLNDEDGKINNLDLDNDEKIDYIRVTDSVQDGVHTIMLQVDLGKEETQNVAAFVVSKDDKGNVQIQVVGDEDLYGKDYIIEPNYEDSATPNPGYQGQQQKQAQPEPGVQTQTVTYVQVNSWPIVQYIYVPTYVVWHSPWYWGYWPGWWRPWRPYYWHYYYGYHYHWHYWYHGYYRRGWYYRNPHWHGWYYGGGYRHRSHVYYNNYHNGRYRTTYSRPQTLNDGSASFKTKFPTAPSARIEPPKAKVPEFKPDLVKPAPRPGTRPAPGGEKPAPRPTPDPAPQPIDRPAPKPTPRPVDRPAPKPTPKPTPTPAPRPTPKPAPQPRPVAKPAPKPASRPSKGPGTRGIN